MNSTNMKRLQGNDLLTRDVQSGAPRRTCNLIIQAVQVVAPFKPEACSQCWQLPAIQISILGS